MVKKILQIGNPILEKKSKDIDEKSLQSKEMQSFIDDLVETAISEGDKSAGISAPQVGENVRIYVARRFDLETDNSTLKDATWDVMVNPKILSKSKDETIYWEGCLSIGQGANQLYGPVSRAREVEIEFLTREGKKSRAAFVEFMSHVILHEIDHLNGILFLSHIKNPQNIWTSKALDDYMKKYDEYPEIAN